MLHNHKKGLHDYQATDLDAQDRVAVGIECTGLALTYGCAVGFL